MNGQERSTNGLRTVLERSGTVHRPFLPFLTVQYRSVPLVTAQSQNILNGTVRAHHERNGLWTERSSNFDRDRPSLRSTNGHMLFKIAHLSSLG